ncbi:MAG: hypothetical protein HY254_23205 [Burkholderiales bacterium]|nr:hypothetical protein [Burkholderiales bacterium]
MLFDWNWFMSVEFQGRWLVSKGQAFLEARDDEYVVSGVMCLGDGCTQDSDVYARFVGKISEDSKVVMKISSDKEDVPSFEVFGTMHSLESSNGIAHTFVLTDGTTVIGFAHHQK